MAGCYSPLDYHDGDVSWEPWIKIFESPDTAYLHRSLQIIHIARCRRSASTVADRLHNIQITHV
ncbi:MAG: hypothetical protein Q8909_16435 [Bacteroidota bacterium]|nr:hypothetical protein [Bacteroidota bacterium]